MVRFELIEENNRTLTTQVEDMFVGINKEWAEQKYDVIAGLDEKTAQAVDNCANASDWLKTLSEEDIKSSVNSVILEFLNKRPKKYKKAARVRVKETLGLKGTVVKVREVDPNIEAG